MRFGGLLAATLLLPLGAACATSATAPATTSATTAPVGGRTSARFRPALDKIRRVRAAQASANASRTRTEVDELISLGMSLIQARMPHDVARPDARRYNQARQAFGDALKEVTYARDANDRAALSNALTRLEGATRRWSDAHLGLAPETEL